MKSITSTITLLSFSLLVLLLHLVRPTLADRRRDALGDAKTTHVVGTYLPLAIGIPSGTEECLYERIVERDEHLTASIFVLSGDELRCEMVFEGPVAPVDLDLDDAKRRGTELNNYLTRYSKEGPDMFIKGKWGDSMQNVKPFRLAEIVDFEEEIEEDYQDDFEMTEREREEFNRHHDIEHRHFGMDEPPPPGHPGHGGRKISDEEMGGYRKVAEALRDSFEKGEEEEEPVVYDDDFVRAKEEMRLEHMRREAELDDDFVKLQMDREKKDEELGGGPKRRRINKEGDAVGGGKGHVEPPREEGGETPARHRRLSENTKLLAGEPYQKTISVQTPGWYRLCVRPKSRVAIDVEMELRKSSTYGHVDPHTGHVPSLEGVEIHSEIRGLYELEDDASILAEEDVIEDEDLKATKEQIRILERLYGDITKRQLEERRTWNWRTIKNQHLHSHLVLGNLMETIFYMGITGWQVYTIRKWFGEGPALGR
mmetsp:Transcript_26008/g.62444  ORF Transcript_26008/g.62444 Transcript_26008/m.62444 type:complete len:483 (-) Transcript_26008:345-1793(-)